MTFLKPFLAWIALGFSGVVVLIFGIDLATIRPLMGDEAPTSDLVLRMLLMVQPTILFGVAVAVGVLFSENVGLHSWLTSRLRGQAARFPNPILPIIAGLIAGCVILIADRAFWQWAGEQPAGEVTPSVGALLYGGITEELMLRYGLLTLLFWADAKVLKRPPTGLLAWGLIAVVALVFGAGHLPAMGLVVDLTPAIIARTIALNAGLALLFGWLYWRRALEAAMLAHMATHVGMWIATLAF